MIFNSFEFLLFFPIMTGIYFFTPPAWRWAPLLAGSCIFYMAFIPYFILILALTILVDYWAGIAIENATPSQKRLYLVFSIMVTLGILFVFKYYGFFVWNVNAFAKLIHWNYSLKILEVALPIGLSFHTFQSMSYVIEVYRGHQKAERHFGIYSLYVMFYPQLVAGPIERPQNLLHQFHETHHLNPSDFAIGLRMMFAGFLRKVLIADNLAILVDNIYENSGHRSPEIILVATIFFAFQIYCDFAGYSLIAIGAARTMGFKLMQNFNRPYLAKSISEFWGRWHISLSTWFKDYLYIPLGGSRVSKMRHGINLMVVFLVSGLWHGASWTFVIWGLIHGALLVIELVIKTILGRISHPFPAASRVWNIIGPFYVFAFVSIAWVFFRAPNLQVALFVGKNLTVGAWQLATNITDFGYLREALGGHGLDQTRFLFCIGMIIVLICIEVLQNKVNLEKHIVQIPIVPRWALYYAGLLLLVYGSRLNSGQNFIYFQF